MPASKYVRFPALGRSFPDSPKFQSALMHPGVVNVPGNALPSPTIGRMPSRVALIVMLPWNHQPRSLQSQGWRPPCSSVGPARPADQAAEFP
jgi:hypothetical protein